MNAMVEVDRVWESLGKWSAAAFVIAGIFRLLHTGLSNVGTFTEMTAPMWSRDWTFTIALVAVYIGLFGLYPRVVDQAPRLSKASVALAALAGVGILLSTILKYLHGAEEAPGPLIILPMFYQIGSPLVFLLFGIASWRTQTPSRTVAFLVLMVAASFLLFFVAILAQSIILGAVQALVFAAAVLALGYVLHTGATPLDTTESKSEPTA